MAAARAAPLLAVLAILAASARVPAFVDSRAVNISNTWILPEDNFPVFYRYFRDRITWYEADAVCQFHHANLVTVDSGAQFDAARAFLKELDVLTAVWVGLKRTRNQPLFTWAGAHPGQPLSSSGYWNEPLPSPGAGAADELCAAADPAADFRWHGLNCGGPEVASFICELPVPTWAAAKDGCMLENMPSLTVAFLPEQAAVELTSDCGLGGTRRVACKGHTTREALYSQLNCQNMISDQTESPNTPSEDAEVTSSDKDGATSGELGTTVRQRRATTVASDAEAEMTTDSILSSSTDTTTSDSSADRAPELLTTSLPNGGSRPKAASVERLMLTGSPAAPTKLPPTSTAAAGHTLSTVGPARPSAQPTPSPAAQQPTPSPAVQQPTPSPAVQQPTPSPAAQTPPSQPTTGTSPTADSIIVAQKQGEGAQSGGKTEVKGSAGQQLQASLQQDDVWTPDKAIIVPIVAKKGPVFPPKKSPNKPIKRVNIQLPHIILGNEKVVLPSARNLKDKGFDIIIHTPPKPTHEMDNKVEPDAADESDDDSLQIDELSNAKTPLALPPAPPPRRGEAEAAVELQLPDSKSKPVKKDGLPAAIAGAAVVTTTTTTTTSTTTTTTPATPSAGPSTASIASQTQARLRESMAGPGGKARTLTTTAGPASASSSPSISSSSASAPTAAAQMSTTGTTIVTTAAAPKSQPSSTTAGATPTPVMSTAAVSSLSPSSSVSSAAPMTLNTSASAYDVVLMRTDATTGADTSPKENRRRQHLPAPLLSMSMKPDSEDGEEGMDSEPQSPPRPNRSRSRSLVRQQHRTFYPYFLNGVLGR